MPKIKERSFKLLDFNVYDGIVETNNAADDASENSESGSSESSKSVGDQNQFIIQMFGINETGKTCSILVDDFKPFFYVKVPNSFTNANKAKFKQTIEKKLGDYYKKALLNCRFVERKKLYGFDKGDKHKFLLLQFHNTNALNKVKNLFYGYVNKKRVLLKEGYLFNNIYSLYLYEGHIPPILRFFHVNEISPSGWISLPLSKAKVAGSKKTSCDFEFEIAYKDIKPLNDKETIVPYKICSFDIEASSSHGDFPLPCKTYKKLAQNIIDILLEFKKEDNVEQFTKKEFQQMIFAAFEYNTYDKIDVVYTKVDLTKEKVKNLFDALMNNPVKNMMEVNSEAIKKQEDEEQYEKWASNVIDEDEETDNSRSRTKKIDNKIKIYDALLKIFQEEKPDREAWIQLLNKTFLAVFPAVEGDKITFIGSTFLKYGEEKPYLNHCIALKECDGVSNAQIDYYDTEKQVMLEWTKLIQKENPDIIIGYNIFGFDYDFMFQRAKENKITRKFLELSRNKGEICAGTNYKTKELKIEESSIVIASGQHDLKFIKMNGRLQVDMYNYFRRDYNLTSYKLDYVAGYFIGDKVKKLEHENDNTVIYTKNIIGLEPGSYINFEETSHSSDLYKDGKKCLVESIDKEKGTITIKGLEEPDMTKSVKWGLAKDDVTPQDIFRMTNEGPSQKAIIAKYCIQDCNLVHHLFKKIDVITGYVEMAKICSVPINFLVMRGQGIKLTSYIAKKCREKDTLMPTIDKPEYREPADGESWDGYDGAIVLDPKCDLYLDKPVACVDYSSLYPSSMISENLSHDSKVWAKEFDLDGNLIPGSETGDKNNKGEFIYDNLKDYQYVDIEHETYKWQANERGKLEKKVSGKRVCRFAQFPDGRKGIMPSILEELLAARKATRKKIKTEPDPFMQNILDKRQLSYKITANSLYGQCGAKTSTFFEKDVAASTTATGRTLLTYARRIIEECYGDIIVDTKYGKMRSRAEYIYGDTDSVFFTFNFETLDGEKVVGKKALEMTIDLAQEAGALATDSLKKPHDLEYEKTFMPFCLLSKKRYIGMLYETDPDRGERKSMGIVLKRRDNAPIVKDVYGGIIDILMKEQDVEQAVKFLKTCLKDIVDEKYPMDKLIISKSLRSTYKNPQQIAHKVLADRMGKRDPGNKPSCGDRIPFVYIETENKKALQGEKIENPAYIIENNIKPNYEFYITNQIMKPVQQVFELVLEKMKCFKPRQTTFKAQINCLKREFKDDQEKCEKKILDLRNKEVKALLFDEFLEEPVKATRGRKKKVESDEEKESVVEPEKPPPKKRGRPRKLIIEAEDPIISGGNSVIFEK